MSRRAQLAVRLTLGLAVGVTAGIAPYEAWQSVRVVASGAGRSFRVNEDRVTRANGVEPDVITRIARAIPPSARYDVELAPRLRGSAHGAAFEAMLRNRLLPRIEVKGGPVRWHIRWGVSEGRCCHALNMGRIHAGEPPVLVVFDA